jgi:2-amino-4-hydroxy-6-hydroxymethyldihydropteridine pyrophosphokinase
MAFVSIYFSLGSNLGNRENNISEALRRMDDAFEGHYQSLSRLIETKPMGFSGGKFLNGAVLYRTFRPEVPAEEAAMEVLAKVKRIEREMGRIDPPEFDGTGNRIYHSRIIDIDILFYGSERIESEELSIPHKGIMNRPFVMIPLQEIAKPSLKKVFPEFFPE